MNRPMTPPVPGMSHAESLALSAGMSLVHRALRPRSDAYRARTSGETQPEQADLAQVVAEQEDAAQS